jgi:hypothetical protein
MHHIMEMRGMTVNFNMFKRKRSTSCTGRFIPEEGALVPIGPSADPHRRQNINLAAYFVSNCIQTWKRLEGRAFYELCLFNYGLFNDTVNISHHIMSNGRLVGVLNWRCGRMRSWPILRQNTGICMEGVEVTTKIRPGIFPIHVYSFTV